MFLFLCSEVLWFAMSTRCCDVADDGGTGQGDSAKLRRMLTIRGASISAAIEAPWSYST